MATLSCALAVLLPVACASSCAPTEPVDQPTMPAEAQGPFPVTRILDGDTLTIDRGGQPVTVRLLGIDTPETVDPSQPAQCYGQEATARTAEQLTGEQVWLQTDPSQAAVDVYGRDLAYVWLTDDLLVNLQLIADGYAREYTSDQPYLYRDAFLAAQTRAQQAHRGLWSAATCAGQ